MKHINFIPRDMRPKQKLPAATIPAVLGIALAVNVVGAFLWNQLSARQAQSELSQLEVENGELSKKIDALGGAQNRVKLDETITKMKVVLAKKNYWSGIFKEMSVIIPEGIWLTGFSDLKEGTAANRVVAQAKPGVKESGTLLIRGESSTQKAIALFLTTLEKSHHFAGVQIRYAEREENVQPTRYKFEFSVPIRTLSGEGG